MSCWRYYEIQNKYRTPVICKRCTWKICSWFRGRERELREKEEHEKKKAETEKEEKAEKHGSLAKLEIELNKHNLKVEEERIKMANSKFQEALSENFFIQRETPKCTSDWYEIGTKI